uniref:GTP-binding protein n=1 Tax=Thermofilum pendens TaxID=2269 RepID=A0A7C4H7D8_THEPE
MSEKWGQVRSIIESADVILEVVDARDPWGTRVKEVEKLADKLGKPLVIVVNKADLVPRAILERWAKLLRRERRTVFLSARERMGTRKLWVEIRRATRKRPVTVAVVGLPNVGKSTIINYRRGRHSEGTSPIPGFTTSPKRVRASRWLRVVDTPGIVPRLSEEELALRSALRPEALEDPVPAAMRFLEIVARKRPEVLVELYGFAPSSSDSGSLYKFIEELAVKRGLLGKGGVPQVEEAARILLRDWQTGRNRFYLEPEDYGLRAEEEGGEHVREKADREQANVG